MKLHYPKLPRQQYPLHVISSTSTAYVDNVNSNTAVGFSDIEQNVIATGTACEGNNSKEGGPITNFDIVRMSVGNVANNNMTMGSRSVPHRLTEGYNTNTTTIDTMCTDCYKTQKVDALYHFTHLCPVISVNEFSNANMCTEGPSSSEMLGVDKDRDLQIASAQSSDVESMKPDRGLGTPEPLDLVCDDALPAILNKGKPK